MLSDKGPLNNLIPTFAKLNHPVWDEIAPRGGGPGFLPTEFEQPEKMDVHFLRLLYKARIIAKVPFRVLDSVRKDPFSAHGEEPCCAVDLQVLTSYERSRVVRAAYFVGFVRVGIYPGSDGEYKGKTKRDGGGVHLDASRTKPQDHLWTLKIRKKEEAK